MQKENHNNSAVYTHKLLTIYFIFMVVFFINNAQAQNSICYVSEQGSGDGLSWSTTTDLTTALSDINCNEIWVQSGIYYPSEIVGDTFSFLIDRPLSIYGGFLGDETTIAQRIPGQYPSILSGNIGDPDEIDDNSEHVLYIDGSTSNGIITSASKIDGFTIRDGYSTNTHGGGIYCNGNGAGSVCSPKLNNINFFNNAAYGGGALYNDGNNGGESSPLVQNSTFAYNTASYSGGAFYNQANTGTSSPLFENVTFYANHAEVAGGVMYAGSFNGDSSPTFIHVTFYGNSSEQRGGLFAIASTTSRPSYFTVINSIVWANTAVIEHPLVVNVSSRGEFLNTAIDVECPTYVGVKYTCTDTITADPKMGLFKNNGGFTLTLLPHPVASAIGVGIVAECPDSDQRGMVRPQGEACDLGAVEMKISDEVIFKNGFTAEDD